MGSFILEKLFNLLIHRRWSLGTGPFDLGSVRRILIVRNDNVGDVLCSTPAIHSLRRAFPDAYLAGLVVKYSEAAIAGNPDLDEVFVYEKAKHRPDRSRWLSLYKQLQMIRSLKKKNFDLAMGLRSDFSWSEAWLVYFTGARYRLGYSPRKRHDLRYSFFYNLSIRTNSKTAHEVQRVLALLEPIGVKPWGERLTAFIPEEKKREVRNFLKNKGIDPSRLIGFHLSSRKPSNRWPAGKFVELAHRLLRQQFQIVLTWGPGDQAIAEEVQSKAGAGVFLFPTATFKELGAIEERCQVFLSPDGGAMHFSTAVGTPTIGLFGETEPGEWAPWGDGNVALRKGRNADLISVEDVYQGLKKIWVRMDEEKPDPG